MSPKLSPGFHDQGGKPLMASEGSSADAKVAAWVLKQYRERYGGPVPRHKAKCLEATTRSVEGHDGTYGCDTGCEYATLDCEIVCPHEPPEDYTYGEFGELSWILEDIMKETA